MDEFKVFDLEFVRACDWGDEYRCEERSGRDNA
jgi:hypothetical protein